MYKEQFEDRIKQFDELKGKWALRTILWMFATGMAIKKLVDSAANYGAFYKMHETIQAIADSVEEVESEDT